MTKPERPDRPHRVPTSDDVAQLAGVSRSAVSRTFTEGASVAPATRERVLEAARALGYRVNFLARSLSQQKTNLIGLVVSDIDNPFRAALMDQLARALVERHYRPFVLPTNASREGGADAAAVARDTAHLIDMMLHYNVSGAIVTSDAAPADIAQECAAYGVPLVLINKPALGPHVANVSMDADKAGRLAAQALSEAGCRRITLVSQRRPSHSIGLRRAGFLKAAAMLSLDVVGEVLGAAQNYAGGVEAAQAFLDAKMAPDGVYCANDYMALGFMDALRHRAGLSIPEALKVVACDDIAEAAWLSYDLTTVRQDPLKMALASVTAMLRRIEDPEAAGGHDLIDVTLVRRGSTGHHTAGGEGT